MAQEYLVQYFLPRGAGPRSGEEASRGEAAFRLRNSLLRVTSAAEEVSSPMKGPNTLSISIIMKPQSASGLLLLATLGSSAALTTPPVTRMQRVKGSMAAAPHYDHGTSMVLVGQIGFRRGSSGSFGIAGRAGACRLRSRRYRNAFRGGILLHHRLRILPLRAAR